MCCNKCDYVFDKSKVTERFLGKPQTISCIPFSCWMVGIDPLYILRVLSPAFSAHIVLVFLCFQAHTRDDPQVPNCYCVLLVQPSWFIKAKPLTLQDHQITFPDYATLNQKTKTPLSLSAMVHKTYYLIRINKFIHEHRDYWVMLEALDMFHS
jgi:hypothetical protein